MITSEPSSRPDPSRSGAVWVTGMGAFLLLAAAAAFTAVRWDQIPDAAKLGTLMAATGGFLIAGRSLRPTLPATAGALFHLGAFLVPIDVAAIGVRAELDWSTMLLAQGVAATATFAWAAAAERSVVLRWAAGASVVVLAAGIGATSALPAPLVLAGFAVAALVAARPGVATAWAALAGTAPLLTFVDELAVTGVGTMTRLGLTGDQPRAAAILTAGIAAAVLGTVGRRRDDVGLALLGILSVAAGAVASWTGFDRSPDETLVGMAVAFAVVEVAAFATRLDPFWRRPVRLIAGLAELGAVVATAIVLITIPVVTETGSTDGAVALMAGVLGIGWLAADRRSRDGRPLATVGMAVGVVGAVSWATTSGPAVAVALTTVAAAAVLLPQRRGGGVVAVVAASAAPVLAMGSSTAVAALTGAVGSVVLTEAAVRRSQRAGADLADPDAANEDASWAWVLTSSALVPGALATLIVATAAEHVALTLVGAALFATGVAAQADRGRTAPGDVPLGTTARLARVSVLAGSAGLRPVEIGAVALMVAALSVLDAVRLRRPEIALGASVALPVAIGTLSHASGLSVPSTGVALTVGAAVLAGLGAQLGDRWTLPVGTAVAFAVAAGLGLAAHDATALADAVIVTGGIGLALAIVLGRLDGVLAAGAVVTAGSWLRLADGGVGASEPYLVPVTVLLLIAGVRAHSSGTSSWVAYGPAVGLLGGSALLERLAGGAGWHAVVAGAVGVLAVAAGGARRLAAPLLLGTALLVGLAGYETLAVTAGLPTWTWLALGGATLLGAGVAMERHDLGPIETGRRLVDVVTDRYT